MDDLMIASMAVASTWSPPAVDKTSSDSGEESGEDNDESDEEESLGDQADGKQDVDEIDLDGDVGEEEDTKDVKLEDSDVLTDNGGKLVGPDNHEIEGVQIVSEQQDSTPLDESDNEDDTSDIDLTEHLANMDEEDDDGPSNNKRGNKQSVKSSSVYEGPRTENEIDLYTCPTAQLEKLNVSVTTEESVIESIKTADNDGSIIVDEAMKKRLRVAGTVRTYLVEQRTIVVDSLIPAALQSQCFSTHTGPNNSSMDNPLDEGSMLVILTSKDSEGKNVVTTMKEGHECTLQIVGKIMEVFGPVQRPLYAIRLPDPPKAVKKKEEIEPQSKETVENIEEAALKEEDGSQSDVAAKAEKFNGAEFAVKEEDTNKPEVTAKEADVSMPEVAAKEENEGNVLGKRMLSDCKEVDTNAVDPWAPAGELSTMLCSNKNAVVYSLSDHSKLIDTAQIIRVSGKGCDASNMYDEEVGPSEQQDFSDDEEERAAKKGSKKRHGQSDDTSEKKGGFNKNNGERSGRGSGRDGGGRGREGRGRGRSQHGNGLYNPQHQIHQSRYNHLGYVQHPGSNMPPQCNNSHQYPQIQHQMMYPPQQHCAAPGYPAYQQQQNYQYQPQYQQQQQYQQQLGAVYGQQTYGVPPPPPPQQNPQHQYNGNIPYQQQQPPSNGDDTVYYDYSGN